MDSTCRTEYRVLGAALSGVATEELQAASGIVSRTYASYAYQWTQTLPGSRPDEHKNGLDQPTIISPRQKPRSAFDLDPRTVLVVDEAGMLGSRDLELLTEHALRNQATLILVGDAKQLQPIMAGGPFGHLLGKIDPARLTENRRQQNPLDAEAVADIRRGDAEKALLNYAARDRLTVGENRNDTLRKLVSEWASNGGSVTPADHQIFTMTRAEAQAVNRLCQRERLLLGGLRGQVSLQRDDDLFVTGDRILFHKNSKADGIRNGYRGVITGIDKLTERLTIRLDTPSDAPRIVTIALRNYTSEDLTLGYAQTTHKGQGQTVGHAYLLLGGLMTDRESAYVQATRGKESTRLYVDRAELGHEWETLIDALNRSNPKKLAHDLGKRSEQQFTEIIPTHSLERKISP